MSDAMQAFFERTVRQLEAVPPGQPLVMINLLRYREHAVYPPGTDAAPCSGEAAYARYARSALGFVAGVGGRVVWRGKAQAMVLGPSSERWDDALLVEYPSREAFLKMIASPDYRAITIHRTAALEDSRLIATLPATD
ncbi:MAG: DUF1330 domain-containing protein [Gammaproteobacteria bacterium]|jgi:uncharacterized protein (DUF1330 family)|nr:DUF1330 domain-containing protein [Gammaproteobacteria bacterium]MDH5177458.1 DUF1330 domain-containing protein [Gammaproteobacteria bacterium]MDH5226944.1 DUF1330 domain-containing protein [Gammaproteobacteria bacterium]